MPWNKNGDTGATHPALMRVGAMREADQRSVNEVAGFFWRLTNLSSAHTTDHVIDAGTVAMVAGANVDQLLVLAVRSGLLTKIRDPNDRRLHAYRLLDDPEFVHIRTRAEIDWERQQKSDTNDLRISVPVRLRDGDQCRYCNGVVYFGGGRPSARKATIDHLEPGKAGSPDTMVVACMRCNSSLRATSGEERLTPNPPPLTPFYGQTTARWLTKNGHPVRPTDGTDERTGSQPAAPGRPGTQPDNAQDDPAPSRITPKSRSGTTSTTQCDPATSRTPPPSSTEQCDPAAGRTPPRQKYDSKLISEPEEMDSGGSGRAGPGARASPSLPAPAARKRQPRRRRGLPSRQVSGG